MTEWSYQQAFRRNLGLINPEEQQVLRKARVGIVGLGGVGGIHLVTMARAGIGNFTIADPDKFDTPNFNRQAGAFVSTLGQPKAQVMAKMVKDINPEANIRVFNDYITESNADEFLKDVDVLIDGIDAYEIKARRLLFRKAAEKGIYTVCAGPVGFSVAWLVFDPKGMGFDEYFDINDSMDNLSQVASFMIGLVPKMTQRSYMEYAYLDHKTHVAPSAGLACQLAAGVATVETLKILLKRGPIKPVPYYHQFDSYKGKLAKGRLWGGNRNPLQLLKRWYLTPKLIKGFD